MNIDLEFVSSNMWTPNMLVQQSHLWTEVSMFWIIVISWCVYFLVTGTQEQVLVIFSLNIKLKTLKLAFIELEYLQLRLHGTLRLSQKNHDPTPNCIFKISHIL